MLTAPPSQSSSVAAFATQLRGTSGVKAVSGPQHVGGDTWLVRAYGRSGGVGTAVEATVGLRNGQVQVVSWERLSAPGVPAWWDWSTEPSTTVDPGAIP